MTTRAVLFDVGGPIDTEVEHERLMDLHIREALAAEGLAVSDAEFEAANRWAVESFAPSAYAAIIWRLVEGDVARAEPAYRAVAARAAERHVARGGMELREGIGLVLESLHKRGLGLGLAANQPARVIADLDRFGLGQFFSHREVSGHHGFHKPDTRLFLRACEDLRVDPPECIMVGDRIDNDIAPARLLGMQTVRFVTGRHAGQRPRSWEETPHAEARDVPGLALALERLLARPA